MHPGGVRQKRRRTRTIVVVVVIAVVVLALLGAGAFAAVRFARGLLGGATYSDSGLGGEFSEVPSSAVVERMDLVSSVSANGSLTTATSITLGFPGPGRLTELSVAVGDTVTAGQVLGRQDPRLAQIELDAAEAALTTAERAAGLRGPATVDEQSARDAQVAQARGDVTAATAALNATQGVVDANAAALAAAVDAAARRLDRDLDLRDQAQADLNATAAAEPSPDQRDAADAELASATASATAARTAEVSAGNDLATAVASGQQSAVDTAQARLDAAHLTVVAAEARVADATAAVAAGDDAASATAASRAVLAEADESVFVAQEGLRTAEQDERGGQAADAQSLASARSEVSRAKAALQVLITGNVVAAQTGGDAAAGTSPEEAQVAVDRAQLDVERAQAALEALTIVAPSSGTVTKVNAAVGDTLGESAGSAGGTTGGGATGASDVITLTTPQLLLAEIEIPETDAIRVEPGMAAEVKFSAIPDFVGTGEVLTVAPTDADTSGGGPIDPYADPFAQGGGAQKTYTVAISLSDPPAGARGGLTIAARVIIGEAKDILAVPTTAISEFEGVAVVQRRTEDGDIEEVVVEIGLRQGGFTQVLSGLEPGDEIEISGGLGGEGSGVVGDEPIGVDGG